MFLLKRKEFVATFLSKLFTQFKEITIFKFVDQNFIQSFTPFSAIYLLARIPGDAQKVMTLYMPLPDIPGLIWRSHWMSDFKLVV